MPAASSEHRDPVLGLTFPKFPSAPKLFGVVASRATFSARSELSAFSNTHLAVLPQRRSPCPRSPVEIRRAPRQLVLWSAHASLSLSPLGLVRAVSVFHRNGSPMVDTLSLDFDVCF